MSPTTIRELFRLSETLVQNIFHLRNHQIRKIKVVCRLLKIRNANNVRGEDRRLAIFLHHILDKDGPGMIILLAVTFGKRMMSGWTNQFYDCIGHLLHDCRRDLVCNKFGDVAPRIWDYLCSNRPLVSIYHILREPEGHSLTMEMDLNSNTSTQPNTQTQPPTASLTPLRTDQTAIDRTEEPSFGGQSYVGQPEGLWLADEVDESGYIYPITQARMGSGEAGHIVHYNQTSMIQPQGGILYPINPVNQAEINTTYMQPYPGTVPESLVAANQIPVDQQPSNQQLPNRNCPRQNPPHIHHPQPRRCSSQSQSDALMIRVCLLLFLYLPHQTSSHHTNNLH